MIIEGGIMGDTIIVGPHIPSACKYACVGCAALDGRIKRLETALESLSHKFHRHVTRADAE